MLSKHGIEDFSITHAAKLDYAAIVAYVAEGQAELCEFPVGGLPPEVLKFMPMAFQPELKRELRQFACIPVGVYGRATGGSSRQCLFLSINSPILGQWEMSVVRKSRHSHSPSGSTDSGPSTDLRSRSLVVGHRGQGSGVCDMLAINGVRDDPELDCSLGVAPKGRLAGLPRRRIHHDCGS